jgi:hypothetical protein
MPVILNPLPDPFDLVIAGEQMRIAAMTMPMAYPLYMMPLLQGTQDAKPAGPVALIAGEQNYASMVGSYPVPNREILRNPYDGSGVAGNSCICSPTGALIFGHIGRQILDDFVEASARWAISGVTKDSAGAALGNCRVVAMETGRLEMNMEGPTQSLVGEVMSDGSGNYSIPVPMNTGYQLVGYKPGSPDVAGVTRNDVTPSHIG